MKAMLFALAACLLVFPAISSAHLYVVPSPTHEQTYAYGSERYQQWITRGVNHHLALAAEFTNDPYVDRVEPREYDDFTFDFPAVTLGPDGHTFYYRTPGGKSVPVAIRHAGFLGDEVHLLSGSDLIISSPHGYLSLVLLIRTGHVPTSADEASL